MTVSKFLTGTLLFLTLPCAVFAAGENIRFESKAEIEVQVVNSQGQKELVRQQATIVVPGTQVIYTNSYTNLGSEPAEKLAITNPVPANMDFIAGSAQLDSAETTYSVDGGQNYNTPDNLTVTEADGTNRLAAAKDYTHIRWKLLKPLKPGEQGQVEYRALLK